MYIVLVAIALSCNHHHLDTNSNIIEIHIGKSDLNAKSVLSKIISDYKFVPLETVDSSLIMEIRKVICYNDFIFILDKSTQKLLKFSNDGFFISQISLQGNGPGEYLEMLDFTIDKENNNIIIADYRKILFFSLNGDYLKSYKTDFSGSFVSVLQNNLFAFYGGSRNNRLVITNNKGSIVRTYFPYDDVYSRLTNSYYLSNYNIESYIHVPGNDTIFSIKDGEPIPEYFLNFGSRQFDFNNYNNLKKYQQINFRDFLLNNDSYLSCYGFLPSVNNIYIQIMYANNYYSGFYNKLSKKVFFVNHNRMVNDLFASHIYINPVGVQGKYFIASIPAYKIVENFDNDFFNIINNKQALKKLNEYSNPILFFYKPNFNNSFN